jgi:hypothetical protein
MVKPIRGEVVRHSPSFLQAVCVIQCSDMDSLVQAVIPDRVERFFENSIGQTRL